MKLIKVAALSASLMFAGVAAAQVKGEDVIKEPKNLCITCHTVDNKLVGPSFKEIAKFYKNDKKKADELAKQIKNGSSFKPGEKGKFGTIPMPLNPVITPEQAKAAAEYILTLK